ncbi:hypothetical protein SLE2022_219570 [Rubroshorea leprosula]
MYVTRRLSLYRKFPSTLASPPPEGPNSGILVIQDEEAEETCCFGTCTSNQVTSLPFPQNKKLVVRYSSGAGQNTHVSLDGVVFIPVLDQPLSSNRYYAIKPRGRHKGEAFTSSTKEDGVTCCYCFFACDVESEEPDHHDIYQQFEICPRQWGGFHAKSVASDGFPPSFLRRKGWIVQTSIPRNFILDEAPGLDTDLQARLPEFNFSVLNESSNAVRVGKWYCPFLFVKDGRLEDQIQRSMYYEMTLEQRWEQIFACENNHNEDDVAAVDVVVRKEAIVVAGREVLIDVMKVVDGVMWFGNFSNVERKGDVGLSLAIVERMKWEMERFGWENGGENGEERIKRVEQNEVGIGKWRKFGCYVLVERFVLRRMDGSLVLTYDFKHTHHIRSKWE